MRRINRFFLFFSMCVIFGMINGCGFIVWSDDKELGVSEVINHAQNQINSRTGYHILTKGQVNQQIQGQPRANYHFELDQKFNNQPQALHSIRKHFQNGSETSQEMYIVDGITYVSDGSSWKQFPNQQERFSFSQNPPDLLRYAAEATEQGITLEKESDAYVLRLNQNAGKGFLQQFYYEARGGLEQQGIHITENDFQTTHFQQSIWIDDQTFDFRKMETALTYSVQYNGNAITYESFLQVAYQGEYNNQINIPDNIKSSVRYEPHS